MLGKVFSHEIRPGAGWILLGLLFLLLAWQGQKNGISLRSGALGIARTASRERLLFQTRGYKTYETDHFIIRYNDAVREQVSLVAEASEKAYGPVTRIFQRTPGAKTLVVLYKTPDSMGKSLGWDRDEQAMGVYWNGSIRVLDPAFWITNGDVRRRFLQEGPMAHEFAHLLVDQETHGNYPRWFTEGIAQYIEKKTTGFEFSPALQYNKPSMEYYDFATLEQRFDDLDTATAYRESLAAVDVIADRYGEPSLFNMMRLLGQGNTMEAAFYQSTGQSFDQFALAFLESAD
ncbi:MAG: peptidase MA family metallohydrolase [Solirubrobacterales bacterium]